MLEQAELDNHKVKRMFKYAIGAKDVHAQLYKLALAAAEAGKELDVTEFYLCPVCGYHYEKHIRVARKKKKEIFRKDFPTKRNFVELNILNLH